MCAKFERKIFSRDVHFVSLHRFVHVSISFSHGGIHAIRFGHFTCHLFFYPLLSTITNYKRERNETMNRVKERKKDKKKTWNGKKRCTMYHVRASSSLWAHVYPPWAQCSAAFALCTHHTWMVIVPMVTSRIMRRSYYSPSSSSSSSSSDWLAVIRYFFIFLFFFHFSKRMRSTDALGNITPSKTIKFD